ncbi:hypothetical protein GCM10025864_11660 [Luteimicrobium album]|uniref:Elongation factor EFG domain-containing protein n=1 Tax=Luteimicrobium album TaxID=1054550 RepID=A0ABQ6HZ24_9MICO|nr:hypothetical protein GCM10025864_11660 [Luteimicrobium album]
MFRTVADPFVGQVSLFRVLSGTVRSGDRLTNATTGAGERLHGLFRVQGKDHHPVDGLAAGEVGAVAKLVGTPSGTILWARPAGAGGTGARPVAPPARQPVYGLSLVPVSQSDDDRMSTALARLVAEDPTLLVERVAAPGGDATVLRGLGDTHLAVALDRLARVFGVHVTTGPVPVAYRETLARRAQAEGKVKKQSGGHGQFAVVELRAEPLPRGPASSSSTRSSGARSRGPTCPPSRRACTTRSPRADPTGTPSWTCGSRCTTARPTRSTRPRWRSGPPRPPGCGRRSPTPGRSCSSP